MFLEGFLAINPITNKRGLMIRALITTFKGDVFRPDFYKR